MLYAILCYHDEDIVGSWTKEQDAAVMAKLAVVQDKLTKQGRLGPVARLLPTTAATTLRKEDPPLVIDGPFAETKEQLLGFYVVDCENLDEALDVARDLGEANPGGAYEIRPVGAAQARERSRRDRHRLDRCRADLGASPGGRRAAALFPRSRHRRGGVPERLPARAEKLAAERAAARSRGVADHGRAQRRDRRRRGAAASRSRCPTDDAISDLDDAESALAERLDGSHYRDDILRLLFICCHPDLPATQQIALALRIVSGLTVKQIARAFLVGEAAMEQRITRAKARVADADVPFETPGAVERAERLAGGGGDDLSDLQRGLFGQRRYRRDPRAAVRGGDPAGAAAAAAVPERAGDHGPDGADAAAARPRRGAVRRRRRDRPARRPGPRALEPRR